MKRDQCSVMYDRANNRLVYRGRDADEQSWDDRWSGSIEAASIKRGDPFVVGKTRQKLPVGARVLDAGCGLAQTVWGLQKAGFKAYGVDYAPETVSAVRDLVPELDIRLADVRDMPFNDSFFDGVWSLGVIEHFAEGYAPILLEMWRVLKPGGLAFVTVPSLSPLRRAKAALDLYPKFDGEYHDFYQFVLSPPEIIRSFEDQGWRYLGGQARGGFKGFIDELGPHGRTLRSFNDRADRVSRLFRAAANRVLAPASFHTRFYLFQKPA